MDLHRASVSNVVFASKNLHRIPQVSGDEHAAVGPSSVRQHHIPSIGMPPGHMLDASWV